MAESNQYYYGQGNAFGHSYMDGNTNANTCGYGHQNIHPATGGVFEQQPAFVPNGQPMSYPQQIDFQYADQPHAQNAHSRSAFDIGQQQQQLHVRRSGYTTKPEDPYTERDPFVNRTLVTHDDGANNDGCDATAANDYHQTQDPDEPIEVSDSSEDEAEPDSNDHDHVRAEEENSFIGESYGDPNEPIEEQDDECQIVSPPPHDYSHDPSEHASACKRAPRVTTPKPSQREKTPAKGPSEPIYAIKDQDLRVNLKILHKFHLRAKAFIPNIPLAAHRYWIGVLKPDKRPKTANEKSFIWIRGNRLITLRTITHTISQQTWEENFVLLHGHDRVDSATRCEELDYFNDKCIILRAVKMGERGWEGQEWCEGIVPKEMPDVIVLDE